MKSEVLSSPIRWAGSKKRVLNDMLLSFEPNKENYIEPFLGSGVVLINVLNNLDTLAYKNFYVNDINSNIINFYKTLQSHPKQLIASLTQLSNLYNSADIKEKEKIYYSIREAFNFSDKDKAVNFYFLMKVGFNGVYRENKSGKFNVPFGRKEKIIIQPEYLNKIAKMIKNVHFFNLSYEDFIQVLQKKKITDNSFIYCDPPYIPEDKSINKKRVLYTSTMFEHNKFAKFMSKLNHSKIIISMSDSTLANKIYGNLFYKKKLCDIVRTINPQKLFKSKEVLFSNYDFN